MNKKTQAKILSTFIGCASLFTTMFVLTGCPQPNTPTTSVVEKNEVSLTDGVANWDDFKSKTFEYVTLDDGSISINLINLDNLNNLKGFSGYANYSEVNALISSPLFNNKKYDTKSLSIYFDYVAQDGEGDEITPTILENILKNFDTVNISNLDKWGRKTPVKFSSGQLGVGGEVDVFDIDKYYDILSSHSLSVAAGAEITQSTTSVNVIGVKDPYLSQNNPSFSSDMISFIMQHPLFINSEIGDVTITGNLKEILPLMEKEYTANTIDFKDSFYKSNEGEIDNINFDNFQDFIRRGNKNFDGIKINADGSVVDTTVNFSDSQFSNTEFSNGIDLHTVDFKNIKSEDMLIFKSILPKSIENITADHIVFDGATVYNDGSANPVSTNFTTTNGIKMLEVKSLNNPNLLSGDGKGTVNFYKGSEAIYNMLHNIIFDIKEKDSSLITRLIIDLNQKYYS